MFYWLQRGKTKKREKHVLKQLSDHIIFLEYHNKSLGENVKAHYDENASSNEFFEQLEFMRGICKEVRADISLFSQDIDEKLIDEFDRLLRSIEEPLPYMEDRWRDEASIAYNIHEINEIKKIIDSYDPKYVKDAQIKRNESMMDLYIANKLLSEALGKDTYNDPSLPQMHVDNKGTFWWE